MNAAIQQPVRTIGRDNGIGAIFFADVRYADNSEGRVVIYSSSLQGANGLLNMYEKLDGWTVLSMS